MANSILPTIGDPTNTHQSSNNAAGPVRRVGFWLGAWIFFIPFVFAWFLLRKGYSNRARTISFLWAAIMVTVHLTYKPDPDAVARYEARKAVEANVATARPSVAQACNGVTVTPCFINDDGQTCRSDEISLSREVVNGNYTVTRREVNEKGICVLTLSIPAYSQTVQVWGHK
jgi:hypothetical protein